MEFVDLTPQYQDGMWSIGNMAITHEALLEIVSNQSGRDWRIWLRGLDWDAFEIKALLLLVQRFGKEKELGKR